MSAAAFFALLGIDRLHMLDIRTAGDNEAISASLCRIGSRPAMDFIIDGGALNDIFSPAAVLRNYARRCGPAGG